VIAYLDCSTGVSGDKLLGALIGAGFDPERLLGVLRDLDLANITIDVTERVSHGVVGTGIQVAEPGAPRRHWDTIRPLLESAALPDPVRTRAIAAFDALAGAEARVHGVPVERVHFHEVGAADTLVDILGVALALHDLGIERLVCSPVAVGSGTVVIEHGEVPVPAPATALLLEGVPVIAGWVPGELTTPTGAALIATLADGFGTIPSMIVRSSACGVGTRDLGIPNVCRLLLGEAVTDDPAHDSVTVLETNLDHLTPEEIAVAAERLLDAGALDVWQRPIVMKKGRSATMLSALARDVDASSLAERFIQETGTLGVRLVPAARRLVERDVTAVATSLGLARFKVAHLPDGTRALRVESDDAVRVASEQGLAVPVAARQLEAEASRITGIQAMRQRSSSQTTNPSD